MTMSAPIDDEVIMARSLVTALLETASEGVMVLDPDFRIVSINKGACRRTGTTPEEARGRFCFQVSHQAAAPCHSPDTPCPMRETLATGLAAHAIHEHLHADGEARYCDVSTYPLLNPQGEVVRVLEIFRDITTELSERMERRTQAIKDDLARLVQEDRLISLGKLVASVAHEINNPIGSILNFSKLMLVTLQEGPPPPETLEQFEHWLTLTVREARRCGAIVSNLLSFARQQSVESRRLDLRELLQQILLLTGHRMELCEVIPAVTLPEEPLEVWGDATQIQQCLTNLVFNAVEAMEQGGRLTVTAGSADGEVWVEIGDTGPGIPAAVLPHIFEPFYTTKSAGHGVGLGLSMVHGIVQEHQGRIEVEPGLGRGARFRMVLPQAEPLATSQEQS
jgi:PAS domain S-box-containing protein